MCDDNFYVVNLELEKLDNVWLGSFWDDLKVLRTSKGIKSSLQQHPKRKAVDDPSKAEAFFSYVIVYMAFELIEADRRAHDKRQITFLQHSLMDIHREHFLDYTEPDDDIRYRIEPGIDLKRDQVVIAFGRCVYVPADDEEPELELRFNHGDAKQSEVIPVFKQQRLMLINNKPYGSQPPLACWPFGDEASVLIKRDPQNDQFEVLSEPLDALNITRDGDQGGYMICDGDGNCLDLQVTYIQTQQDADSQVTSSQPDNANQTNENVLQFPGTTDDASVDAGHAEANAVESTFNPAQIYPAQSGLRLVALSLQRLSQFRHYGFKQLQIGFNEHGDIVAPGATDAIALLIMDSDDRIVLQSGDTQQEIDLPYHWQITDSVALDFKFPVEGLSADYAAMVTLVKPLFITLADQGRLIFGRGQTAHIAPSLLSKGLIMSEDESRPAKSAEQLSISREMAELNVTEHQLSVKPISSNPLWHLDTKGQLIGKIENYAARILPDEYLLSGHYLFQFIG